MILDEYNGMKYKIALIKTKQHKSKRGAIAIKHREGRGGTGGNKKLIKKF